MRCSSPYHPLLVLAAVVTLLSVSSCEEDKQAQIGFSSVVMAADLYPHVRVTWESLMVFGRQQQSVEVDKKHTRVGPFETAHSGTLHIQFQLLDGGSPSATAGSFDLPLQEDWRWGVDFIVSDRDPLQGCWGCVDSNAFDLDPAFGYTPDFKLWAVWGGNSISNPVVY
jgi:hypothetical protein